MAEEAIFSSLRKPLSTAQAVFVFLPQNPGFDQVAAGLGLFLSLKKTNKAVSLACPTPMKVEFSQLFGVDQIKTEPAGRNLVVSFDYLEDSIEKVSYNIENNKFNLVVQPKSGFPPLSSDKVAYSYSGGEADLIFTIGVRHLNELGELFQKSKSTFDKQKMVDIDLTPKGQAFAQTEIVFPASGFSEIIVRLIARLGLPMDEDLASNLLLGIEKKTNSFASSKANAATFEAAAFCLRAGARRAFGQPRMPQKRRIPLQPMPAEVSAAKKPAEPEPEEDQDDQKKPAADWLEPKIYKGNTRI